MKKYNVLASMVMCVGMLMPTFVLGQSSLEGMISIPDMDMPKIMSCGVEGVVKQVNTLTNEITYKVKYGSNYSKANAPYTLYAKVTNNGVTRTLLTLKGSAAMTSGGTKYFSINGKEENTLRFAIKDNPGVTVSMNLDGIPCTFRYFKTIDAMVNVVPKPGTAAQVQLNGNSIQDQPQVIVAPSQGSEPSNGGTVSTNVPAIEATNSVISNQGGAESTVVDGTVTEETTNPKQENLPKDSEDVLEETVTQQNILPQERWRTKDIITVGLLSSILVALVTYMVMKYRGMM